MEISNGTQRVDLVHRTVAFGLAFATTSFIATSVAVVFTGNTVAAVGAVSRIAYVAVSTAFGG